MTENYVYVGDQLGVVLNASGAIQYEYLSGSSLDQVFVDQLVLSGAGLWLSEPAESKLVDHQDRAVKRS